MQRASEYDKQTISPTQVIILSLKHPTAPPNNVIKQTVMRTTGVIVVNLHVREEQCVHSIVANKKHFFLNNL